jgi:hypothetical protein
MHENVKLNKSNEGKTPIHKTKQNNRSKCSTSPLLMKETGKTKSKLYQFPLSYEGNGEKENKTK